MSRVALTWWSGPPHALSIGRPSFHTRLLGTESIAAGREGREDFLRSSVLYCGEVTAIFWGTVHTAFLHRSNHQRRLHWLPQSVKLSSAGCCKNSTASREKSKLAPAFLCTQFFFYLLDWTLASFFFFNFLGSHKRLVCNFVYVPLI